MSVVADCKDKEGLHFEKIYPQLFKVLHHLLAKPKMYPGLLFLQKIDYVLVLNFKAMYPA